MIALRAPARPMRVLSVLLDLGPDGEATLVTDAQDDTEHREALARLRRWIDRGEVERLLDGLAEEGDQR